MKDITLAIIIGIFAAVFLAEWAVGCGETYIDANGIEHRQTCVFVKGGV